VSEIENREPRLPVVYRDDHLLVVNKPTGLLAQADYSGDPDVLTLARQQTGDEGLRLAHRLDRPTSGLMVLARTKAAAQGLSRQFRERHAEKRYLAVVEGAWEGWGEAVDYLAPRATARSSWRPRMTERNAPPSRGASRRATTTLA